MLNHKHILFCQDGAKHLIKGLTCFGLQSPGDTRHPHSQRSWTSTLSLVQTSSWTPEVTVTGVIITGTSLCKEIYKGESKVIHPTSCNCIS